MVGRRQIRREPDARARETYFTHDTAVSWVQIKGGQSTGLGCAMKLGEQKKQVAKKKKSKIKRRTWCSRKREAPKTGPKTSERIDDKCATESGKSGAASF